MNSYKIEFKKSAQKEFYKLPKRVQNTVLEALSVLAQNPFSELLQIKKLHGTHAFYRVRLGNYRILYELKKTELTILVIAVGTRQGIYRGLS